MTWYKPNEEFKASMLEVNDKKYSSKTNMTTQYG